MGERRASASGGDLVALPPRERRRHQFHRTSYGRVASTRATARPAGRWAARRRQLVGVEGTREPVEVSRTRAPCSSGAAGPRRPAERTDRAGQHHLRRRRGRRARQTAGTTPPPGASSVRRNGPGAGDHRGGRPASLATSTPNERSFLRPAACAGRPPLLSIRARRRSRCGRARCRPPAPPARGSASRTASLRRHGRAICSATAQAIETPS